MIATRHDLGMDTHLTPINEAVVREREESFRVARERAANTFRERDRRPEAEHVARPRRERGSGLDLFVVTLFAILAAGFVSLVVTTLQVG